MSDGAKPKHITGDERRRNGGNESRVSPELGGVLQAQGGRGTGNYHSRIKGGVFVLI